MKYLLVLPLIVLAVGFGLLSAQAGAIGVLLVLLLSGGFSVLWRMVKALVGVAFIIISLG